jgi:hypothetical protein
LTDSPIATLRGLLDWGQVAFLATLEGTGVNSADAGAVFSFEISGTGSPLAQSDELAPGADSARFKSFQELAVAGASVGFLAELVIGSGSPKATAETAQGLWAADATHPLTLLMRQGDVIAGRTVSTMTAFLAGKGSPGQGRGWITASGGETEALSLVTFTDKTAAVVSATIDGTVTILAQSDKAGGAGAPALTGAEIGSFGVPALSAAGGSAFLARLATGDGGVKSTNQNGIFQSNAGTGEYDLVAREGEGAPGFSAAAFSGLQDVALASDGSGLAFPATITGKGLSGAKTATLWWQPAAQNLGLLAQGGAADQPPGTPTGAQWASFTSLAIAGGTGNGPIFSATLRPGSGGVTSRTDAGVWGVASDGSLRLLFRTGDSIDGKTLKSYVTLTAATGSTGVPRWFNATGQLVWVATFTDGSTAVVVTALP